MALDVCEVSPTFKAKWGEKKKASFRQLMQSYACSSVMKNQSSENILFVLLLRLRTKNKIIKN